MIKQELKNLLFFNPKIGIFTWIKGRKKGSVAGSVDKEGYIVIHILGKIYKAHRLAFLYMTGKFPEDQIDHVDGNPSNNAWDNLRKATNRQNQGNKKLRRNNTSGYKGVGWHKSIKKWYSSISYDGKIHLGYFEYAEDAALAYNFAAIDLFGEFARLNEL